MPQCGQLLFGPPEARSASRSVVVGASTAGLPTLAKVSPRSPVAGPLNGTNGAVVLQCCSRKHAPQSSPCGFDLVTKWQSGFSSQSLKQSA